MRMNDTMRREPIWLIYNEASGSNDRDALQAVGEALQNAGFAIAGRTCFPHDEAPDAARLDGGGIGTVVVFAGDGTIHTIVTGLFGWSGKILVLPGGTMNMLSHRLHGDVPADEIVARWGRGEAVPVRPPILTNGRAYGLTGALAGPGVAWNEVREAMRHTAVSEMASATVDAIVESVKGEYVVCVGLEAIRPDGYVALSLVPEAEGVAVKGYYAAAPGDFLAQLGALLQRNYRKGPHDMLGVHPAVRIASPDGQPMGLLMDGEEMDGGAVEDFVITTCRVDLLATRYDR